MMSSTEWAHRILSPATLHSVIVTVLCRCVTRPVAVTDRWPTTLMLGCSRTVAQSC
jgi:heme A synthase